MWLCSTILLWIMHMASEIAIAIAIWVSYKSVCGEHYYCTIIKDKKERWNWPDDNGSDMIFHPMDGISCFTKKNLGPKVIVLLKLYVSIFFGNLRFYRIRCLNFHRFSLILSPNWVYGFIVVFWFHKCPKIWSPNVGLEPTTLRLRVSCSTDWASRANYYSEEV